MGHGRQKAREVAPGLAEKVLTGHSVHSVGTLLKVVDCRYEPAAQAVQEVAPNVLESEPATHRVQDVERADGEKLPGGHAMLAPPPPGHAQPAGQSTVLETAPAGQKLPAGQFRHDVARDAPVVGW